MNPVIGAAKVDKILSQFSQFYTNSNYIAELILPRLAVKERTGKFAKYGKENLRAYSGQILRAPGTRAHSVDYSVSQGSYACTEKSLEKLVANEFVNNTDDPYSPKRDATAVLMDNIMVNQEVALSTALSSTAIITQNVTLSGTDKWSDQANSSPLTNIDTAIETVRAATGQQPNLIVFSRNAWLAFRAHPDVREQLKYTNGGNNSVAAWVQFVKDYFNLEEVLVGNAVYNSANEGQTDVIADIWANNVWVAFRAKQPTLMKATLGLTLSDVPREVDTYRDESRRGDVLRIRDSYDQNLFDTSLAYLIKSAV